MKYKRIAIAFVFLLLLTGCGAQRYQTDFFAMNTMMSVEVLGGEAQEIAGEVVQRVNELDRLLSRTREESDIYHLNHGGALAQPVAEDTAYLISSAQKLAALTQGAYDPTIASLTDLWGIGTDEERVPSAEEIQTALQTVGYENIEISSEGIRLTGGAQLDLGGIAKGYAADMCTAILRERGISGLLGLGGNIYAVGDNNGIPWKIGIADPDNSAEYIATVSISDLSVVTTGDYERFFEQNSKRYHHVFDPMTGVPAETDVRSVTVIGAESMQCDAYSTALFVMGLEKGLAFCEENGVAAVFVTPEKRIYATSAVHDLCVFEITGGDKGYIDAG